MVLGGTVAPRAAVAQAAAASASQPSAAKDPATAATAPTATEAKKPARRRRRPVSESVEKAVDEVMQRHYDPCAAAAQKGVPCFPSRVDVVGPRFSVAEAMRKYRPDGRRAEGAPITASDMRGQMGGAPLSASGGASFDPVCTVKSLIRRMSGTGKFYLYSLSDGRQQRPVLTDRKLDPAVYASNPQARYEYLGEFSGECEAIAAWRKELREDVAPPPGESSDQGAASAPAPPPAEDEITIEERRPPPGTGPPPP
jgi:hypothetical protein